MKDPVFMAFLKALLYSSARRDAITIDELKALAKIPREEALVASSYLKGKRIINMVNNETIDLENMDRIGLSLLAIREGLDPEASTRSLSWRDFEKFVEDSLSAENFKVLNNLYFMSNGNRRQIDLLAIREPLILSIDCKHWRSKYSSSRVLKAVKSHIERTRSLADNIMMNERIRGLHISHRRCFILPVIVLLMEPYNYRIVLEVPVVPLLKFRDFLRNIPPIPGLEPMKYIPVNLNLIN
ncbi:MAG: nuclease-related domain-containing protein [Candidatus Bathyarchaeia archaeon]